MFRSSNFGFPSEAASACDMVQDSSPKSSVKRLVLISKSLYGVFIVCILYLFSLALYIICWWFCVLLLRICHSHLHVFNYDGYLYGEFRSGKEFHTPKSRTSQADCPDVLQDRSQSKSVARLVYLVNAILLYLFL